MVWLDILQINVKLRYELATVIVYTQRIYSASEFNNKQQSQHTLISSI